VLDVGVLLETVAGLPRARATASSGPRTHIALRVDQVDHVVAARAGEVLDATGKPLGAADPRG
jgi:hypothetical protein